MNDSLTLRRLRGFLLALCGFLFLGTTLELLLAEHYESPTQLIPFVLIALGLIAILAYWLRPGRRTILFLRVAMVAVILGSLVGIGQHLLGNYEFALETTPGADASTLLRAALSGGAPLLAPSVLAVTSVLAMAATYSAPAPRPQPSPDRVPTGVRG